MATSAKRCAVCGKAAGGGCEGTVCNQQSAVEALLADLERRTGVSIVAEADAELTAHAERVTRERAAETTSATVERIAAWFSAKARGEYGEYGEYAAQSRPSCPHCGGWLYVDVDIDEVEQHAAGTREIVCINCAWRCYVWVGKQG